MHVQSNVETGAPLSERFTLVVITHNRPAFLRRTLQYYKSYPSKILVLDSSPQANAWVAVDFPEVDYRHLPQFSYTGLQDKVTYGVEQVTTPYMVFAADDDFLLHGALTQSVEFLEANPDYGMCHGYGMMYVAGATEVHYFRRDRRVCEDYASELGEERVMDFMGQFLPPFYAVTRTDLLRQWYRNLAPGVSFEWQEIGHAYYLLACAKARILPIPFAVREGNYGGSEHNTNVLTVLTLNDPKTVLDREQFAEFLATLPTGITGKEPQQLKQIALDSFSAMAQCLLTGKSLASKLIFRSSWKELGAEPTRRFVPQQFVEMPFYNQPMFDLLTEFEFLIHTMPADRLQLKELEGILLKQNELMRIYDNDDAHTIKSRLWEALDCNPFNREVVARLGACLTAPAEQEDAARLRGWAERLAMVPTYDGRALLDAMPSGRLLSWLDKRGPDQAQLSAIRHCLSKRDSGPVFGILLLDLEADMFKLQATLDSLVTGHCKAFKLTVFTAGELPATTRPEDTLHFVKVSSSNYVEQLNAIVEQSTCDWLLLAQAGDRFTPSGLLRASLELFQAGDCRAVAMDEIHQQPDGTLSDIFRPGVSLDLLQSVPALMSRHWLVRRDVLLEADGYRSAFSNALEFDLLLRLIEQGGLAGLAHLAEPLLITQVEAPAENTHEREALVLHLAERGYKAQVDSPQPGTWRIDYRHAERPVVSIILSAQNNPAQLQASLVSVLQRTRYQHYEILIADNCNDSPVLLEWLASLDGKGDRLRVLRAEHIMSASALVNWAGAQAKGEYLILLDAEGTVVNANWVESLLNQAQRPEVGVVGARLVSAEGATTQAGLVLGGEAMVRGAFAAEGKNAKGYMQRLLVEQNYSAVSSACLMIRKELFEHVGGLDETVEGDAYGAVDLCLKASVAGYLTVWTPHVQVLHPGALDLTQAQRQGLQDKWPDHLRHDPLYSSNHALDGKAFTLGAPREVEWRQLID